MIKRESLKKGDPVLIVPNSFYTKETIVSEGIVKSIGPRYVTVESLYNGKPCGRIGKYYNDENLSMKDFGHCKLFLGTREEYEQSKAEEQECKEIYKRICTLVNPGLGLAKLREIERIVNS